MKIQNDFRFNWQTANREYYTQLKIFQKELKNNPTEAEAILWSKLAKKQLGYKFRRQHIMDVFIVDFVCLSQKLILELDGKIHDRQKEYDEARTSYFEEFGYNVIRFTNDEILQNLDNVIETIKIQLPK